jgi:glycosyltransferase involved in cell wall biosynthesis
VNDITVVIPTVPKRSTMLARAVGSVVAQTAPPDGIIIVVDSEGRGAPEMRSRGLELVKTKWVAFLDDDDEFKPIHLEHLHAYAEATDADLVYPWFDVMGGSDPFPINEHRVWTADDPHQTTVTTLVKTEAALAVGGFRDPTTDDESPGTDAQGHRSGEEFRFVIRLGRAGYKIEHLDEHTWIWHHWGGNSSGMPSRI